MIMRCSLETSKKEKKKKKSKKTQALPAIALPGNAQFSQLRLTALRSKTQNTKKTIQTHS